MYLCHLAVKNEGFGWGDLSLDESMFKMFSREYANRDGALIKLMDYSTPATFVAFVTKLKQGKSKY